MVEISMRDRSPSFPFIPLAEAIDRLKELEDKFGRHPAPASKVGLAWGVKDGGSQGAQIVAALKAFGLVDYEGTAADRKAFISEGGRSYLRAQQESIKAKLLQDFATKPAQLSKFWGLWGRKRPPDPVCLDSLVLENAFTESAAKKFLRVYDQTLEFANLFDPDEQSANDAPNIQEETPQFQEANPAYPLENIGPPQVSIGGVSTGNTQYREERISLDEGDVVLRWPTRLCLDSVEDFKHWLEGVVRRAERRASSPE